MADDIIEKQIDERMAAAAAKDRARERRDIRRQIEREAAQARAEKVGRKHLLDTTAAVAAMTKELVQDFAAISGDIADAGARWKAVFDKFEKAHDLACEVGRSQNVDPHKFKTMATIYLKNQLSLAGVVPGFQDAKLPKLEDYARTVAGELEGHLRAAFEKRFERLADDAPTDWSHVNPSLDPAMFSEGAES